MARKEKLFHKTFDQTVKILEITSKELGISYQQLNVIGMLSIPVLLGGAFILGRISCKK